MLPAVRPRGDSVSTSSVMSNVIPFPTRPRQEEGDLDIDLETAVDVAIRDLRDLAERLRADLALLPELAEAGLCRAAKDISMAGVLGTALMLVPFGLMGTVTLNWNTPFAVPLTVLLLSFMMGLQNAVGSKTSGGSTRTTHMTGNFTDLGMELGKALFWRRQRRQAATVLPAVQHDWRRMRMTAGLIAMFVLGGITGALGFKHIGFFCVVPLALLLLALSVPPFLRDAAHSAELQALWRRFHQR